jgi:hypothetical protein
MKTMQNLLDGYDRFKSKKHIPPHGLPQRPKRGRAHRFFIDNEFLEWGYLEIFPNSVFVVYAVLAKYANSETQSCFPSVATIMREGGIKEDKTVYTALRLLEKYHLIATNHSTGRSSNDYLLLDHPVWIKLNPVKNDIVVTLVKNPEKLPEKIPDNPVINAVQSLTTKSNKEISDKPLNSEEKMLRLLPDMTYKVLLPYFDRKEVADSLKEMQEQGIMLSDLDGQKFVGLLGQRGVVAKNKIPWL